MFCIDLEVIENGCIVTAHAKADVLIFMAVDSHRIKWLRQSTYEDGLGAGVSAALLFQTAGMCICTANA